MHRTLIVLVAGALALGACSSGDDGSADRSTTTSSLAGADETTATELQPVGDGSTFCDAMIAVGQVSQAGDSPAQVLAATNDLADQLDEAEASLPEDSPPDLASLLDDYRAAVASINAAAGDIAKAYASLPKDVVARLSSPTSHKEGYDYLVRRCGITSPP